MDRDEFREAVMQHKDRVHSYASWMLRDGEEARDVAQEALVRLWQNSDRVHNGSARAWLLRTTRNLCIDRIRRRRTRPEVDEGQAISLPGDPGPGPERLAASSELGRTLHRALEKIQPRDRALVLMREVEGLTYDEMAGAMGLPLGTLKAALHRAREKLRRELAGAGVTP